MLLLRLALLNLWRSKRRTVLSTAAIMFGVFFLIAGRSLVGGLNESIYQATIQGLTGHVTLLPANYPDTPLQHPLDDLLVVGPELRTTLDQQAQAWTERLLFTATVVSGADSLRVRAIGFDPVRDPAVFPRELWKVRGAEPREAGDGLLVSTSLAALLDVEPGGRVVLKVRTRDGALNALDLPVAGVVDTGNVALNQLTLLLPMALAQDLVRAQAPSHISLRLDERDAAPSVAATLAAAAPGQRAVTWVTESEDMMRVQEFRVAALNMLVGMLMVMSSLAIANTILMAAHERVREIGTLRSMGLSRRGVLGLFIAEGAFMGAVAGLVGAGAGAVFAFRLSRIPIDLGALMEERGVNLPVAAYLFGRFDLPLVVFPWFVSIGVAIAASVYPAVVASRMEPADAVRA